MFIYSLTLYCFFLLLLFVIYINGLSLDPDQNQISRETISGSAVKIYKLLPHFHHSATGRAAVKCGSITLYHGFKLLRSMCVYACVF